ncbi:MAG: hypothetical protein ACR2H9_20435 [Longimicrobiaceae bacterium]
MAVNPARIELEIGELVLHGVAPGDRHRIGAAVERELARLLAERGLSPSLTQNGEVARLDAGALHVAPGARAESIGRQVAQSVHRGLAR